MLLLFGGSHFAVAGAELIGMQAKCANRGRTKPRGNDACKHRSRKENEVRDMPVTVIEAAEVEK